MLEQQAFPLSFPGGGQQVVPQKMVLAGDIGGTKSNLAIFQILEDRVTQVTTAQYHSPAFPSLNHILRQFMQEHPDHKPGRICLGVAGPVFQGRIEVTNLPWHIDQKEIAAETGVEEVLLINDLEATAYGLAGSVAGDFVSLHQGDPESKGNMAIIAPGTGLGEAGLYWDGTCFHPYATEGGHCDFSARTADDLDLHDFLLQKYKVVSWESVIAGPAIYDIYKYLCTVKKRKAAAWLTESFAGSDPSALISQSALDGKDPVCKEAMELFIKYLARESCNLILKTKATGGLFLGGGIPPKIIPLLKEPAFYDHLQDCDRMQDLIRKVPVRVMMNDRAAMIGAGWYGLYASM
jgi:glucokinase